ncbi:fibronectin type III domain-containing protein [Flavobacterium sp. 3HN19-14]|uniref:fibronectin type III domain-containing protein n=1 Tax=Flavobacterium sp. 3HN19-14 TaxID=3448133 RepID=UPI003EE36BFC
MLQITVSLYWTSGNYSGIVRYYLHSSDYCGAEAVARTKSICCSAVTTCEWQNNIQIINITSDSATVTWNQATNSNASYFVSADDVPYKTYFGTLTEIRTPTSTVITALQPNTTYYYYVQQVAVHGFPVALLQHWQIYIKAATTLTTAKILRKCSCRSAPEA